MFSRQVDAERECMACIAAPPEAVYPVIADACARRSQGIVTRERLVRTCIVIAALKNDLSSSVENRAPALSVATQRSWPASGVTDDNLLTVLSKQLSRD